MYLLSLRQFHICDTDHVTARNDSVTCQNTVRISHIRSPRVETSEKSLFHVVVVSVIHGATKDLLPTCHFHVYSARITIIQSENHKTPRRDATRQLRFTANTCGQSKRNMALTLKPKPGDVRFVPLPYWIAGQTVAHYFARRR